MLQLKLSQTAKGVTSKLRKGNFNFKVHKNLLKALRKIRKVDVIQPFEDTIEEILSQLLDDTLNRNSDTTPKSKRGKLSHYVTGDLFRSVDVKTSGQRSDEVTIEFGYFKNYGLNLELGGPRSKKLKSFQQLENGASDEEVAQNTAAYPIIEPIWNKNKDKISDKIIKDIFSRFKSEI